MVSPLNDKAGDLTLYFFMIRTWAKNTKDPILALGLLTIVRHQEGSYNVGPSVRASQTISSLDCTEPWARHDPPTPRDGNKDGAFLLS